MKSILRIIILSYAMNSINIYANEKEEAAIKSSVESVALLADTNNFESLEKLYAPEVKLDYSSLTGGKAELKSPSAIMTQWALVLPGFERTRHELSNIKVNYTGETVTATADVIASHWLGELFWQVKGNYEYQFIKDSKQWLITSHKFNLVSEKGTRDIFEPAVKNAKKNPVAYLKRQQTKAAVTDFLKSLEIKDMKMFANVWADDAVQEMPYSPKGFPNKVSGKKNIIKHYSKWPENSGKADFTSQLVFYRMTDPEMIFVEFKGDVEIIPSGRKYKQHYGGLFHVQKGKIKLFREYFNPELFKFAFGLSDESK